MLYTHVCKNFISDQAPRKTSTLINLFILLLSLPKEALDLLDRMLTMDPSRRASCEDALKHEFLRDIIPENVEPPK